MRTIAIGLLGIVLAQGNAAAQTVQEQTQIIRAFQDYVADYSGRHHCLDLFHAAMPASTPAPRIFTLPVATVFRQLIARTLEGHEVGEFPALLARALPPLPSSLEYRWIDGDLVLRDVEADVIVAVLRDAAGHVATVRR